MERFKIGSTCISLFNVRLFLSPAFWTHEPHRPLSYFFGPVTWSNGERSTCDYGLREGDVCLVGWVRYVPYATLQCYERDKMRPGQPLRTRWWVHHHLPCSGGGPPWLPPPVHSDGCILNFPLTPSLSSRANAPCPFPSRFCFILALLLLLIPQFFLPLLCPLLSLRLRSCLAKYTFLFIHLSTLGRSFHPRE